MKISTTVEAIINVPLNSVFQFNTQDDVLPRILIGTRFLPRVIGTSDATGPWDKPGSKRTVHLAGGMTAREELLAFTKNEYFEYKVSQYTFVLKYFTKYAIGQWWFKKNDDESTAVKWTYSVVPHNLFAVPFTWIFMRLFWRSYMENAMMALKVQLEEMRRYHSLPPVK